MENFEVYRDIEVRTGGEIYIGIVGPVRTGKSTFVRRFMETVAIPGMDDSQAGEIRDQLPVSGSGKMITTVEPKFIPKEAMEISLGEERKVKVRLIDCVGFLVKDASGHLEEGRERMVKTPWYAEEIPFHEAAERGTRKVIAEHSTIGLVITGDGSFGEIPGENFREAQEKTIQLLKKQGKPFLVLVNSQKPYQDPARRIVQEIEERHHVTALAVNCEQLRREDVTHILEKVLYEFPVTQIQYYIPKWVEMLPVSHPLKSELLKEIRQSMKSVRKIRDVSREALQMRNPYVEEALLERVDLSDGTIRVRVAIKDYWYYQMLSEVTGISIENEYELMRSIREFASLKKEYVKVQAALESVRGTGYGVVIPELSEIELEEPAVIRQGNKFGVKIKSKSPSIHMIRTNIETEIAPIVGTEQQAKDLIQYIQESGNRGESIWETNIFGKSIEQLVEDGIQSKISVISEESQVKLQDTMQKIVNDSKGGMVCIII